MTLNANKVSGGGGKKYPHIEAGAYPGRLVQLVSLGLQPQRPFKGEDKPPAQELMLTYELSDEFLVDDDGEEMKDKPRWQTETLPFYPLSSDKAKCTKRYKVLDPNVVHGGDWNALLGSPCIITITVSEKPDGKVYNNVGGISTMRAKDVEKLPPLVNPTRVFDWETPDMEVWAVLPDWIQDKIKNNLEFEGSVLQNELNNNTSRTDTSTDEGNTEGSEGEQGDGESEEAPW